MDRIDWKAVRDQLATAEPIDMPPHLHGAAQEADAELAAIIARRREVIRSGVSWRASPARKRLREINDEYAERFRAFVAEQCQEVA